MKDIIKNISVASFLVFLLANMYPNLFPAIGTILALQLINPTFWLTIIVIAEFGYILKLKNWI